MRADVAHERRVRGKRRLQRRLEYGEVFLYDIKHVVLQCLITYSNAIRNAERRLSSLIFLMPAGINLITFYHIAAIPSKLFLLQNERAADTALRPIRGEILHFAVRIEC